LFTYLQHYISSSRYKVLAAAAAESNADE